MERVVICQNVLRKSLFEAQIMRANGKRYKFHFTQKDRQALRDAQFGDFTLAMCLVAARGAIRLGVPFDPNPFICDIWSAPLSVGEKARFAKMVAGLEFRWTEIGENLFQRGNRLAEIDWVKKEVLFSRPIAVDLQPKMEKVYA